MSDAETTQGAPATTPASAPLVDPGPVGADAIALAQRVGMSFTVADALTRAGRHTEEPESLERWLDPKLAHLTSPAGMADLTPAAQRIARAIRNNERVAVFGDYDCDGITATAIMTEVIRALGGEAVPLIANRFEGGYGFTAQALARVQAAGASLLVTCDCGSSDHERIAAARKVGIDTVVIDHHLVPDEPLPALAFLNPHRPDCGFAYKGLASCGLALFMATALRKELNAKLDVRHWLDLVAVGTIADVAPLTGDNRALVRAGLRHVSEGERIGLRALALNGTRGRKRPFSAEDVAFQIAPRINAPGRLGNAELALNVLLERDPPKAWMLAERVEGQTEKRRAIQRKMTAEALAEVASSGAQRDSGLVLAHPNWHPGVVGIVAGRLADQLGKPTIVIGLDGARGRGSARAPSGFRLYDAIKACTDQLVRFGGHQAAAGVEVEASKLNDFRDAFVAACDAQLEGRTLGGAQRQADVRLDARDDIMTVLTDLERLEPCGQKNPAPRILVEQITVQSARDIKGHLKLEFMLGGQRLGAFGPDLGEHVPHLVGRTLSVVARIKRDHWHGGQQPELLIESLGPIV